MFVSALSDPHVGYANISTLQLLTQLYAMYTKITDYDLEENKEAMAAKYNVNLPTETFFKRIEECVQYAAAGNTPFTAAQVVSTTFRTTQKTGMFTDECKICKRLPMPEKTWAQFKIDFTLAHSEIRESQQTMRGGGFHTNNVQELQQETATAIANLANETLADRETMTSIQATITTLKTQLSEANQKLVDAFKVCTTLKEKIASTKNNCNNRGGRGNGDDDERRAPVVEYTNYCHTHGILISHNSGDCTRLAAGHKVEATVDNKMGGRTTKWRCFDAGS